MNFKRKELFMPEPSPDRLPFEPRKKRPKAPSETTDKVIAKTPKPLPRKEKQGKPEKKLAKPLEQKLKKAPLDRQDLAIPEAVSNRMVKRMIFLSGFPILMGVLTFLGSYFLVINDLFSLPNTAVLLVSMGWFGLGVLGLSYGVISASWEEDVPGSILGWQEFAINFQRLVGAWQEARQKSLK